MSTFDATTPAASSYDTPVAERYDNDFPGPPPAVGAHASDEPTAVSTLDELRAAAAEVDPREPIQVVNPKGRIRLTLRTDVSQSDVQRWSNLSLPREERARLRKRGGNPNLSTIKPVLMFATAIAECTTEVEVLSRATGEWVIVADERTGDPLTFDDPTLRQIVGGIDAVTAVKNVFNKSEAALLRAGDQLIDATGFGDDIPGDSEDPTNAAQ